METKDAWQMTDSLHVQQGKGDPFAAAIRATRMPMIVTDARQHDNPIVFANDAFLAMSGYSREFVLGRNCRFLQGEGTDRESVARLNAAIDAGEDIAIDILNYRKNGEAFWNALYISPVTNEAGELLYFFASQLDVTQKKLAEITVATDKDRFEIEVSRRTAELSRTAQELREALAAKMVLLHEVDHRVKNNLQMVASMILMQSRGIADPEIKASLRSMLERVEALSTVHRRLYQSDDVARFDVAQFARDLVTDLVGAAGRTDLKVNLDLETVEVPSAKAAPIALILNELVTNALKHAFPDGAPGTLSVTTRNMEGEFALIVQDSGAGMPETAAKKTFGTSLINSLTRQLQARIEWDRREPGTKITLVLPVEQPKRGE